MSKSATGLLILALLSGVLHFSLFDEAKISPPLISCAVFVVGFILALVIGRRIKFDPVLR
ncbi:PA3371 family protein [Pseudomonas sp. TWP3-2]|uniref:PA3371 family protein n=1 Tax=Pseudomonas sp. TWP3-2 TaxID=2804574 RepID=UPI003CFB0864